MTDAILKRLTKLHTPTKGCACPVCNVERAVRTEVSSLNFTSTGDRAAAATYIIVKALSDHLRHFTPESRDQVIAYANERLLRQAKILASKTKAAS